MSDFHYAKNTVTQRATKSVAFLSAALLVGCVTPQVLQVVDPVKRSNNDFVTMDAPVQVKAPVGKKSYDITLTMDGYLGGAKSIWDEPEPTVPPIVLENMVPHDMPLEGVMKKNIYDEQLNIIRTEEIDAQDFANTLRSKLEANVRMRDDGQKYIVVLYQEADPTDTSTPIVEKIWDREYYDKDDKLLQKPLVTETYYVEQTFDNAIYDQIKNDKNSRDLFLTQTTDGEPFVIQIYLGQDGTTKTVGFTETLNDYVWCITSSKAEKDFVQQENGLLRPASSNESFKLIYVPDNAASEDDHPSSLSGETDTNQEDGNVTASSYEADQEGKGDSTLTSLEALPSLMSVVEEGGYTEEGAMDTDLSVDTYADAVTEDAVTEETAIPSGFQEIHDGNGETGDSGMKKPSLPSTKLACKPTFLKPLTQP